MSLDLIMGDTIFESGIHIDLPVADGCLTFGLGGNLFGVNLVENGVQPEIKGSPTKIDAYSTLLGPAGYLDLKIKESENFTYFAVFKLWNSNSGGNSQLIGTFQDYAADGTTGVVGSGIVLEANGLRDVICSTYDGASGSSSANNTIITDASDLPTTEAAASWRCLVGCYDGIGGIYSSTGAARTKRIFDKTVGKSASGTIAAGAYRDMRSNGTMRVGNVNPRVSQTKSFAYMGHAFYNRQLTSDEINTVYQRFKDIGAIQGQTL